MYIYLDIYMYMKVPLCTLFMNTCANWYDYLHVMYLIMRIMQSTCSVIYWSLVDNKPPVDHVEICSLKTSSFISSLLNMCLACNTLRFTTSKRKIATQVLKILLFTLYWALVYYSPNNSRVQRYTSVKSVKKAMVLTGSQGNVQGPVRHVHYVCMYKKGFA